MKEFDFDELDKAVTSIMGPGQDDSQSPAQPVVAAEPISVQQKPAGIEPVEPVATVAASEPQVIRKTTSTMPAKRSGRFMDVVHPSSDMKTPSMSTTPTREAKPVEPTVGQSIPTTEQPSIGDLMDAHLSEDEVQKDLSATATPDAIATQNDVPMGAAPLELSEKLVADQEPTKDEMVTPATEPASSPFLADAKVEKRPLGNGSALSSTDATTSQSMAADTADTAVVAEPLQAELNQDVLAIEADNSHEESSVEEPNTALGSAADKPQEAKREQSTSTTIAPDHMLAASAAGASIAPQYKQQASTGDQHHEALYDTAAKDTQALAHPPKKKSGWLVVLWIVLLIALGVGGAVALYFLKVI